MSSEILTEKTNSERDARATALWILVLSGSIGNLYYEYLWSRFALGNPSSTSLSGWLWTSLTMATPWMFCVTCLFMLQGWAKNGRLTRDVCLDISMFVALVMSSAYTMLIPEIHKLTALGALK